MKPPISAAFFFALLPTWATIPSGVQKIRYSIAHSSSMKLWKGKAAPTRYGDKGKMSRLQHTLTYTKGLDGLELSGGLTFSQTKMDRGKEGGVSEGDSRSGFSGVSLKVKRPLFEGERLRLSAFLGARHPIHEGVSFGFKTSPDVFIAPNDGSFHLFFGPSLEVMASSSIVLQCSGLYRWRSGAPADQMALDLLVSHALSDTFSFGLGGHILRTLGGPDIGTPSFKAFIDRRSGRHPKIKAFSVVKEERLGAGAFVAYAFSPQYTLDAYYDRIFKGRNTDQANSLGFGVNYFF